MAGSFGLALFVEREERAVTPLAELAVATFEDVYRAHYQAVYRYVLLLRRRPDDADDLVADAFSRAFTAWRSGHGPAGRPLPWLLLIARRLIIDRGRRERLLRWVPFASGQQEPRDPDQGPERVEFWIWLDALSRALSAREREVLCLRYQRDLSDAEIGEILGLSASGVRTLAMRALKALRAHPELWQ